jgi:hypothetical protein
VTDDLAARIEEECKKSSFPVSEWQSVSEDPGEAVITIHLLKKIVHIALKAHLDRDRKMKAELADEIHGVVLCLQADSVAIHQGLLSEPDALEEHWNELKHYADSLETIQAALEADSKTEASE